MSLIRCIVIDDNQPAIDLIKDYVSRLNYMSFIKGYTNPLTAMSELDGLDIDLIFLDMQMPEISGLELLKIKKPKQLIIVISDYKEFAVDTYELNTYFNVEIVDYLSKVIKFERFSAACEKAKSRIIKMRNSNPSVVFLKDGHDRHKLAVADIIYIESEQQYKTFYIAADSDVRKKSLPSEKNKDNDKDGVKDSENSEKSARDDKPVRFIMVRATVDDVLSILPPHEFVRISHKHVISIHHLVKFVSPDEVIMSNGKSLTISNSCKESFSLFVSVYRTL